MKRLVSLLLAATIGLSLVGCAGGGMPGATPAPVEVRTGRIEQITEVSLEHPHQLGVGAILGSVAGAGLGSLIGAGTGRDVAIAVGAIAGAVGGQYAQNRFETRQPGQQVIVRLPSGVLIAVTQPVNPALRVGQLVYVEGSGPDARVLPR